MFLWNGPGYPLLIAPFVGVNWTDGAHTVDAVLHAGSVVYAWLVLRPRMPKLWAFGATLALGLYPPARDHLPLLYTEILAVFLVSAWIFHALRSQGSRFHTLLAGALLALLCLTKVVYGPALTAFVILSFAWWRLRRSPRIVPHLAAGALGLALCVPYLSYTYRLTGKPFHWSSAWPNAFYWLSSPYPEEVGDWYHQGWVFRKSGAARAPRRALSSNERSRREPRPADARSGSESLPRPRPQTFSSRRASRTCASTR